jgi:predicted transcriptional regulator with HTH domain
VQGSRRHAREPLLLLLELLRNYQLVSSSSQRGSSSSSNLKGCIMTSTLPWQERSAKTGLALLQLQQRQTLPPQQLQLQQQGRLQEIRMLQQVLLQ